MTTYHCAAHVCWVQDADRIIVADPLAGQHVELRGAEAAVWSWMALSYRYPRLLALLAAFLAVSPSQAAAPLQTMLDQWVETGLLRQGN